MKRRMMLGLAILVIGLPACSDPFGVYSPERIRRTVQSRGQGLYVVSYKEFDVINAFGPGVENVRADVRKAGGTKEKLAVWDQAVSVAAPRYLEAKGLVPSECTQGVVVTRSGSTEGGGGWAEFRCK